MPDVCEDLLDKPVVIHEDESVLAVFKPHRMHCAELRDGGPSLASWVARLHPETAPAAFAQGVRQDPSDGGLLHRLDFETAGLVLFARSPRALEFLTASQEAGLIRKTYSLLCSVRDADLPGSLPLRGHPLGLEAPAWGALLGTPDLLPAALTGRLVQSRFRPYGPRGARVACILAGEDAKKRRGSPGRFYETEIANLRFVEGIFEARVAIRRGFRHQIRAHFAWIGLPLSGDSLYGGDAAPFLSLVADSVSFEHPSDRRRTEIALPEAWRGIPSIAQRAGPA